MTRTSLNKSYLSDQEYDSLDFDQPDEVCRMLIYSHDTFGLGHLQRCLKIARALSASIEPLSILIATGSPVVHRYSIPERVDYIKLPSVRKVGPEKYESRTLGISHQRLVNLRSSLLLETVKQFQPHLILIDHSPTGMKGEMKPALEFARENLADCVTTLGLRDIIDDPGRVKELWSRENIYPTIEALYDHILVYGDPSIYDMTSPCGFTRQLKAKTVFTGFLGDRVAYVKPEPDSKAIGQRQKVLVSVGGGDGATESVLATYLKMIRQFKEKINFDSCLITGPFVPEEIYRRYESECDDLGVELIRFVDSTTPYFETADLVISTAGYNSVTQILQSADQAILIPRVMHRQEQELRASIFDKAGLIKMIHPQLIKPENLYEAVTTCLSNEVRPLCQAREAGRLKLTGLDQIVKHFQNLISANQQQKKNKKDHVR